MYVAGWGTEDRLGSHQASFAIRILIRRHGKGMKVVRTPCEMPGVHTTFQRMIQSWTGTTILGLFRPTMRSPPDTSGKHLQIEVCVLIAGSTLVEQAKGLYPGGLRRREHAAGGLQSLCCSLRRACGMSEGSMYSVPSCPQAALMSGPRLLRTATVRPPLTSSPAKRPIVFSSGRS